MANAMSTGMQKRVRRVHLRTMIALVTNSVETKGKISSFKIAILNSHYLQEEFIIFEQSQWEKLRGRWGILQMQFVIHERMHLTVERSLWNWTPANEFWQLNTKNQNIGEWSHAQPNIILAWRTAECSSYAIMLFNQSFWICWRLVTLLWEMIWLFLSKIQENTNAPM